MKILLIGGNGYIGSRLYEYLITNGYSVDNADLCLFGKVFEETMVCDYRSIPRSKIQEYSHIILLAGHSCPSTVGTNTLPVIKNNVINFIDLIEKTLPRQQLIYASTAAIYGNSDDLKFEDDVLNPAVDFYTYTKQAIEQLAIAWPGLNSVGLRFGTVGGISKNFRSENLLNSMSVSAFKTGKVFVSNPELYRSILGINDLCRCVDAILSQGIKRKIYNLVSDVGTILYFGSRIRSYSNSELVINDSMKTGYSFNCSSLIFQKDYNFKFQDTTKSIYLDVINNLDIIKHNHARSVINYE